MWGSGKKRWTLARSDVPLLGHESSHPWLENKSQFITQMLQRIQWQPGKMLALWVSQVGIKTPTAQKRKPRNHEAEWSLMWPGFADEAEVSLVQMGLRASEGWAAAGLSPASVWCWAHDWQPQSSIRGAEAAPCFRIPPGSYCLEKLYNRKPMCSIHKTLSTSWDKLC